MRSATFDTDAEGWTTTNGSLVWQAAGGDPGGNLRGVEGGSGLWGFQAGAEFLGDLSSHIGGTLSFDLKQDIATAQVSGADVVIVAGDGTTLVADIGPNPGTDWTSYSLIFGLGGNWRVDSLNGAVASRDTIAAVFSDIASFYIRGEFVNGITGDAANLDNVVLSDPGPPPSGSGNRIASTFESGIDGWSFINDVREFRHVASGGKSGGYLESVDYTTGEIWYFAAADKFLGNKSAFYNGVLSWEQKQSGAGSINEPDIVIGTTGLTLFLDVDTPTTDWSHYAIAFNDQMGWRVSGTNALATEAEIRTVLADLQFLHIRGEFISGADTGGLDNVVLERPARTYLYSDATQATQLGAFGNLSAAIAAASPGNFIDVNQPTLSASLSPIVVRADGLTVQVAGPYTQQLKFFSGVDDITIAGSGRMDILGWNAADRITGGRGNDTLNGAVGNDTLTGGLGADSLIGGRNNDTYVNPTGDTIVELADEGTDTVQSNAAFSLNTAALANVERLALTGTAAITGTGNVLANLLTGNAGRNTLSGLAGSDTLMGGDGDDSLAGGDNDDVLAGGAGNDTLLGQSGADALNGGAGDDTYVDPTGDTIVDTAGLDTVRSGETFSLAALPMIENLTLTGSAAISGIGNDGANVLTGGTGANLLDGGLGNDTLNGGSGDDTLMGGNGADVFNGGAGRDTHDLGSDSFADTVLLSAVSESTGLTRDLVIGIDLDGEDRFDLPFAVLGIAAAVTTGALNAASFTTDLATALGAAALPGRNAVLFDPDSGDMNFADTVYLVIDANNTAGFQAGADYVLELRLPSGPLTPDDFI